MVIDIIVTNNNFSSFNLQKTEIQR